MDEAKMSELRGMLATIKMVVPWMKDMEQLEAEAKEYKMDLRSYVCGYAQGVQNAAKNINPKIVIRRAPAREERDITNLWGLL